MSEQTPAASGDSALVPALEAVWPGSTVVGLAAIPESHSGFTYMVQAELEGEPIEAVLRLPPPGARPVGPADVARQARVMAALADAGVAVPRILAGESEPVLDGRPFVLMERVAGVRIEEAIRSEDARTLVGSAFEAARAFHEVEAGGTGIGEEQAMLPGPEVERWRGLRERAPEELVRRAPELEQKLLAAVPPALSPRLVHGDYHLGNLLFDGSRVVAVLDWEICQLGQSPLDEAALCLVSVRERFGEPNPGAEAALPLEEMVEISGIPDFDWYLAATCHKYASILGYNLGLHRRGRRLDPVYEELLVTIPGLVDVGLEILA